MYLLTGLPAFRKRGYLWWALIGAFVPAISVLPTSAATGLNLYAECQAESAYCAGYIDGAVEENRMARIAIQMLTGEEETDTFCIPEQADAPILMSIVADFIEQHPELSAGPGNLAVIKSMQWAFPCAEAMD